jgi:hypothetical protein
MALAPKFVGQKLAAASSGAPAHHTLEICKSLRSINKKTDCLLSRLSSKDLDYVCPVSSPFVLAISKVKEDMLKPHITKFSAKLFNTFYTHVSPIIDEKYKSKLDVIFRQQIQPWHPSSTLTHEAGAAVLNVAPEKFWEFSAALFKQQTEFFDVKVVNETRNETYKRLANIAGNAGVDEKRVLDLLLVSDKPSADGSLNIGNGVTNDVKKMIRVRAISSFDD